MNLCLVGYGAIARKHMEAFTRIGGIHPRVLVGRRPEPTAAFADEWRFDSHTLDLEKALADQAVDIVVITSPNAMHFPQACKALEQGKHVLREIPIAMNFAEARHVTELSRQHGGRFMVCHTMRTMPGPSEIRRRVTAGELRLHSIICSFGVLRRSNTTWTGAKRSWTDNILWHHGAHLVDLALWAAGSERGEKVHCRFGPPHPRQGNMDLSMSFALPGGIPVTVTESYNISTFRWRGLFIGEEATLEFREGVLYDGDDNVIIPHHDYTDVTAQNREFIAAVLEGRDPAITGESVLPAMEILQKAQQSADEERVVP